MNARMSVGAISTELPLGRALGQPDGPSPVVRAAAITAAIVVAGMMISKLAKPSRRRAR